MSDETPFCPTCGTALALTAHGDLHAWVCPQSHGLAATLTAGYGTVEDDELHQLWKLARTAAPGTRKCPMCEQPMVVVDLPWDADEIPAGEAGGGPDLGHEELDVCQRDEVIWFDTGELEALPADIPNPEPTPAEQAKIQQVADGFVNEYVADREADLHSGVTGALFGHIQRRRRRAFRLLDLMTSRATSMTN